jgi:hypothetical protein
MLIYLIFDLHCITKQVSPLQLWFMTYFCVSYSWPAADLNRPAIKASQRFIILFVCNVKGCFNVCGKACVFIQNVFMSSVYISSYHITRNRNWIEHTCNFALRCSNLHFYLLFRRFLVLNDHSSFWILCTAVLQSLLLCSHCVFC